MSLQAKSPYEISPANVKIDVDGFVRRSIVIRVPDTILTAAILIEEPRACFSAIQRSPSVCIRALDDILFVATTWLAEAICLESNAETITLGKTRIQARDARSAVALFATDEFQISFVNGGYDVVRKADQRTMASGFASAQLAERHLTSLYPKKLG